MGRIERELIKKLEREKHQIYESFLEEKMTLDRLKEKLSLIYEIEKLIGEEPTENILLDKREIRELAGKTLYISLPKEIIKYGWNKDTKVKISIDKKGRKIILERVE